MKRFFGVLGLVLATQLGLACGLEAQTYKAEGSDTVFGMGGRHIAMGGTGVATADDPLAIFYNPAALTAIDGPMVSITRQLDGTLRPYAFAGATLPIPFAEAFGLDMTLGVARYNRVHARSTGLLREDDFRSIFVRFLLPSLTGDYDGEIDSKTLVNRLALGMSPSESDRWSFGVNLDYIDCKTETCGVEAGGAGFRTRSVHATALSLGASARYALSEQLTLAASWTDIDTTLTTRQRQTDASGTRELVYTTRLPSKVTLGAAWRPSERWLLAAEYQKLWGSYGTVGLNFETLHLGAEYQASHGFVWRGGLWAPLALSNSLASQFTMPVPAVPTAGLGWKRENFSADLAVYAHPVMSVSEDRPVISADLTLGWRF